jgi:fructose-1,6-bisphosphatase/inositol monophosphatase family enzyme
VHDVDALRETLRQAAAAVVGALDGFQGSGLSGGRHTQYALDVVADDAACGVLLDAGLAVFSEESGNRGEGPLLAVVDPVDGSTNADRGIPFCCVSICILDDQGALASLVRSISTGVIYEAARGRGATRDGVKIQSSGATEESVAIIGVNGVLTDRPPWAQVRTMGAAALEICLVADGALDGYVQVGGASIHPWDYLAGMQIVEEAGGCVLEASSSPLVITTATPRRPVVGASKALAEALRSRVER